MTTHDSAPSVRRRATGAEPPVATSALPSVGAAGPGNAARRADAGPASAAVLASLLRRGDAAEQAAMSRQDRAIAGITTAGGVPLPAEVNERFSAAFGHDFSHVRVHAGAGAQAAAQALHAHAFAMGADLYFGPGEYRPGTREGDRLLAHELTHVVQNDRGRIPANAGLSSPTDPREQEAYANEGTILARLAAVQADPLGALAEASQGDAAAQQAVEGLANRLAARLGIAVGALQVRADAEGAARAQAAGSRGLAEGNTLYLDPARFDPGARDGRELVAHEVVHAAQASLTPNLTSSVGPGALAEAEAHLVGSRLASGLSAPTPQMGLPSGHVAAEGDLSAESVRALLEAYNQNLDTVANGLPELPTPATKPAGGGTENREKKVSQYRDGIEAVAGLVEDLPAYDEFEEAYADREEGANWRGPLATIKASEPYRQLCDMYQGAKDGGEDAATLMAAFNAEIDSVGNGWLWDDDDKKAAFSYLKSQIPADAKRNAEAAAAAAEMNKPKVETSVPTSESEGPSEKLTPDGEGVAQAAANGDLSALRAADVNATAPVLPTVQQMHAAEPQGRSLGEIQELITHQQGVSTNSGPAGEQTSRGSQVWQVMRDNFIQTGTTEFTNQLFDTLVLDQIGQRADKLLNERALPFLMGKAKIPTGSVSRLQFIGPMIGLIQGGAWKADFWVGDQAFYAQAYQGASQGAGKLCNLDDHLSRIADAESFSDGVGMTFALLADLFGGLHDILKAASDLISTLSAICYVAGGILILLGLALVWLAGVGAPLITAGGWMVRAGSILARINTALGPVVQALALLQGVFRPLAALLVPADQYADQLGGVADSTNAFTTAASKKMADETGNSVLKSVQERRNGPRSTPTDAQGDGTTRGQGDADGTGGRTGTHADQVQQHLTEGDRLRAEAERQRQQQQQQQPTGEKKPTVLDRAKDVGSVTYKAFKDGLVNTAKSIGTGLATVFGGFRSKNNELRSAVNEGGRMLKALATPEGRARLSAEGLVAMGLDKVDESGWQKQVDDLQTRLVALRAQEADLTDGTVSDRLLRMQIHYAERDLALAKRNAEDFKKISTAIGAELTKARQTQAAPGDADEAKQKEKLKRKELVEAEKEVKRTEEEARRLEKKLTEHGQDKDQLQEANKHIDGYQKAEKATRDAKNLQERQARLRQQAEETKKLARNEEVGRTKKGEIESAKKAKTQADTAIQQDLDKIRSYEKVLVNLGGTTQKLRLTSVGDDGTVVVTDPHTRQQHTVTLADLQGPGSVDRARNRVLKNQQASGEAEATISKLETELQGLDPKPTGQTSQDLLEKARALNAQADGLQTELDTKRGQSTYAGTPHPLDFYEKLKTKVEARMGQDPKAERDRAVLERDAAKQRRDDLQKEVQALQDSRDAAHLHNYVRDSSSGNATGGVGSAFGDIPSKMDAWIEVFTALGNTVSGMLSLLDSPPAQPSGPRQTFIGPAPEAPQEEKKEESEPWTPGGSLAKAIQGWMGTTVQKGEEITAIGNRQAALEQLLAVQVPVDVAALTENRRKAAEAAEKHAAAHEQAYKAYQAELVVAQLAAQTQALAEQGDPVLECTTEVRTNVVDSQAVEAQRLAGARNANATLPEPDSALTGIVTDLILKLTEHGDDFDQQPDAGNGNAGADVSGTQRDAKKNAASGKEAGVGGSEQQQEFLTQSVALADQASGTVRDNQSSLESKHQSELDMLTQIQNVKAAALMEREARAVEAETYAQAAVTDLQTLRSWAETYQARRSAFEAT